MVKQIHHKESLHALLIIQVIPKNVIKKMKKCGISMSFCHRIVSVVGLIWWDHQSFKIQSYVPLVFICRILYQASFVEYVGKVFATKIDIIMQVICKYTQKNLWTIIHEGMLLQQIANVCCFFANGAATEKQRMMFR